MKYVFFKVSQNVKNGQKPQKHDFVAFQKTPYSLVTHHALQFSHVTHENLHVVILQKLTFLTFQKNPKVVIFLKNRSKIDLALWSTYKGVLGGQKSTLKKDPKKCQKRVSKIPDKLDLKNYLSLKKNKTFQKMTKNFETKTGTCFWGCFSR